jgi:endoplasmic reticulum-Golgi intermediate compartment protein 3
MFSNIQKYDMHIKTLDGVTKQTVLGALMTVAAILIVLILFLSEVNTYNSTNIVSRMQADGGDGTDESVRLHFDIDFMHISCDDITFAQEVVRGQVHHFLDKHEDAGIKKDSKQYNSDDKDTSTSTPSTTGCWIHGSMVTDKIAGNMSFKVKPQKKDDINDQQLQSKIASKNDRIEQMRLLQSQHIPKLPKMHHRINHMLFLPPEGMGSNVEDALNHGKIDDSHQTSSSKSIRTILEKQNKNNNNNFNNNKKDGDYSMIESEIALSNIITNVDENTGLYHYGIQIVPTNYKTIKGGDQDQKLNQYSVIQRPIDVLMLIDGGSTSLGGQTFSETYGIVFTYDFYPLIFAMEERKEYFIDFAASLFGIIGGVITMIGLVERCLAQGSKQLLGKKD